MRQPSMSPGIASRRSAMTVSKEWLEEEAAGWEESAKDDWYERPKEDMQRDADLASALRELLALRAADEGAVTVEGWMYREEGGSFTFTPANMGGMERWESVTVTSRRRP